MPARKFTSRKKPTAQDEEDLKTTAPQEKQELTEEETLADAIEKEKDTKEDKTTEEPAAIAAPEEPAEIEATEADGQTDFKVNNAQQNQESEEIKENKMDEDMNQTDTTHESGGAVGATGYRDESLTGLQMDNQPGGGSKKWIVILLVLLLLGAGGFFAWKQGLIPFLKSSSNEDITPTSVVSNQVNQYTTPAPQTTPQASPSAKIEDLKFDVQNGTDVAGEATALKSLLEAAGFKNVTAGNASTTDHTATEVSYPSNLDATLKGKIQKILEGRYAKVTQKTSSSSTQIAIVIGDKK